jgi:hypothetical protein
MKRLVLVLALALAVGACGGEESTTDQDPVVPEPALSSIHENVFTRSCIAGACHDSSSPAAALDLSTAAAAYEGLVGKPTLIVPEKMLVVPGDPDGSFLIAKLRGELGPDEGEPMPYANPPLHDDVIGAIEAWIASGAADD